MIALAWHIEALQRHRRLPSLASLLQGPAAPAQSVKQLKTTLAVLAETYGGRLSTRTQREASA